MQPVGANFEAKLTSPKMSLKHDDDTPADSVQLHHVYEVVLQLPSPATSTVPNMFLVNVSLVAQHDDSGTSITMGGFYDGDSTWRVRFQAGLAGRWRWRTAVTEGPAQVTAGLTRQGEVRCVASNNSAAHGAILVDRAHPHHFVWQDGTRPEAISCVATGCNLMWNIPNLMALTSITPTRRACSFSILPAGTRVSCPQTAV